MRHRNFSCMPSPVASSTSPASSIVRKEPGPAAAPPPGRDLPAASPDDAPPLPTPDAPAPSPPEGPAAAAAAAEFRSLLRPGGSVGGGGRDVGARPGPQRAVNDEARGRKGGRVRVHGREEAFVHAPGLAANKAHRRRLRAHAPRPRSSSRRRRSVRDGAAAPADLQPGLRQTRAPWRVSHGGRRMCSLTPRSPSPPSPTNRLKKKPPP